MFQDQTIAVIETHGAKMSVSARVEGLQSVTLALL
jgi:hypothetical protein